MNYKIEEKYELIEKEILESLEKNPINIVSKIMKNDYINIHGPEHHFLDAMAFLVAYRNCKKDFDITKAVEELKKRTIKMPGAMCGMWGVCGSATGVGAAFSIIHETGPLSSDDFYKQHMEYTATVIKTMSVIGGPRCCKRNAFISLLTAVVFVRKHYNIDMEMSNPICEFSLQNKQCLKEKCPFYKKKSGKGKNLLKKNELCSKI